MSSQHSPAARTMPISSPQQEATRPIEEIPVATACWMIGQVVSLRASHSYAGRLSSGPNARSHFPKVPGVPGDAAHSRRSLTWVTAG